MDILHVQCTLRLFKMWIHFSPMQTKCKQNANKMQKNANKIQTKCNQNAIKMQSKCKQNANKMPHLVRALDNPIIPTLCQINVLKYQLCAVVPFKKYQLCFFTSYIIEIHDCDHGGVFFFY